MSSKNVEERISFLEGELKGSLDQMNKRFESLEHRIETLDKKIDERFIVLDSKIDEKFTVLDNKLDSKVESLRKEMNSYFKWTITLIVGLWISSWMVPILLRFFFHV